MTPRRPGLRLHARTMEVAGADSQLHGELLAFQEKTGLTDIEMLQCLASHQAQVLKWMLRAERHPEDPGRKADEE